MSSTRQVSCALRVRGRKNYRLQDIQLSKIIRGSAPNPGSVARGAPAPLRFLAARSRSPRRIALSRCEAVICQRAPLIERLPQARV